MSEFTTVVTERKIEETIVSNRPDNPGVVKKTTVVEPTIKTDPPQKAFETKKTIFRTYQIVWYILSIVETLLIFRFALKAIGSNPLSGFVAFIYSLTDPLALPFQGIVRNYVTNTSVFEWGTIIALFVYVAVASAVVYLFQLIKPVTPEEVNETVDNP